MGGGGDGGYGARQAEQEAAKQAARNALNVQFGIAPPTPAPATTGGNISRAIGAVDGLTEFADAQDASQTEEAARNKAALDALYGRVRADAFTAGKRRLDEDKERSSRDLKFELFARGLNGGSVDVDQNALLGRTYTGGLTDLGGKADASLATLKAGDESARLGLLQSIDSGMDQGSALSSALAQMNNNAAKASADAIGTNLGDLFSGAGLLYEQGRRARGEKSAAELFARSGYGSRTPGGISPSGTLSAAP